MRAKQRRGYNEYDDNEYNDGNTTEYDSSDTIIMITMNITTAIQYDVVASWHGDTIDMTENDGDEKIRQI
eukprot:CAMPEP_0172518988 /NCGR_PEP_ID=MMETSP1066-20121228/291147_1 /TAXON_ID=671091 /ORGANISM="Coscinodiscus wailesii, Strain CCMP2513" /LENGTH=69 /DNA_ID=CAMNT_0013301483 /DNA_START=573 /DNA_END=782 /DNA_ORIENTATION=+